MAVLVRTANEGRPVLLSNHFNLKDCRSHFPAKLRGDHRMIKIWKEAPSYPEICEPSQPREEPEPKPSQPLVVS